MKYRAKAVALISGGLDSMLAARVVRDQGVHVEGINFFTGFCVEGHTHAIRKTQAPRRNNALWVAEQLGIKLHIIDVIEEYKNLVLRPHHGYGAHLNPCIDCKGFMTTRALDWMHEHGFDFIITGEVVGQRPMSQRKDALPLIANESGAGDRLLRPLCASTQSPTLPERRGWLDVTRLPSFGGRTRKPQIRLAAELGIEDYAQPSGGCCFLANRAYSSKLKDLWRARGKRDYEFDDIMLLKIGRHLRPRPHFKLIVGREEGENRFLRGYRHQFVNLTPVSHPGPLSLVDGEVDDDDLELAARLTARFSKGRDAEQVRIEIAQPGAASKVLDVCPFGADDVPTAWYV